MSPPLRFGTDGIRGPAAELTDEAVRRLGSATARVLGSGRFLIARDTRESGPRIEAALSAGLLDAGCEVEVVGVLPTAGLAYLCRERSLSGAMISASHNAFADNGIKLFSSAGRKLADPLEAAVEAEMQRLPERPPVDAAAVTAAQRPSEGHDDYVEHLVAWLGGRRLDGLRVAVDCANGAAFEVAPEVLERVGAQVDLFACAPDGRNINHECGSTHPGHLQRRVAEDGFDVGLAFDGDADRLIAVDETGELVDGDHFLGITALDLHRQGRLPKATLVTTVMANLGLRLAMQEHDIAVVETKVGDRYVVEAMDEGGYALGGEQSGHVIFAEHATTGDGILSALSLLDVMARTGRRLSELARVITKLPQVLENVHVADRDALDGAAEFWAEVAAAEDDLGDAGRVLVRPSGTEPVVRVMVEAESIERAREVAERLCGRLRASLGDDAVDDTRRASSSSSA